MASKQSTSSKKRQLEASSPCGLTPKSKQRPQTERTKRSIESRKKKLSFADTILCLLLGVSPHGEEASSCLFCPLDVLCLLAISCNASYKHLRQPCGSALHHWNSTVFTSLVTLNEEKSVLSYLLWACLAWIRRNSAYLILVSI